MPDHDPAGVHTLLLEDRQLRRANVGHHGMRRDRESGPTARPCDGAVHTLLGGRDPRLVGADLPEDPGPDPGVPDAVRRLCDELLGKRLDRPPVDEQLGRVVRGPIPAGPHDEVQAAPRREAGQPPRVAPDARRSEVDERAPSGIAKRRQLLEDERLVAGQLPVVPAALDLPQVDLRVLVREGEPELSGVDRTADRHDVCHPRIVAVVDRPPVRSGDMAEPRSAVPDVLAPGLRLVLVGINPGRSSAEAGAHFANPRNDFWRLLSASGLTPREIAPGEQFGLLEHGIGVTNAAGRMTPGSGDLRAADFAGAAERLEAIALDLRPAVMAFVGKEAYRGAFRERAALGEQARTLGRTRLFVLPSTSPANAAVPWAERLHWFEELARASRPVIRPAVRAILLDRRDRVF